MTVIWLISLVSATSLNSAFRWQWFDWYLWYQWQVWIQHAPWPSLIVKVVFAVHSSHSAALLWLARKTWQPLSGVCRQSTNSDVLICWNVGTNYSGTLAEQNTEHCTTIRLGFTAYGEDLHSFVVIYRLWGQGQHGPGRAVWSEEGRLSCLQDVCEGDQRPHHLHRRHHQCWQDKKIHHGNIRFVWHICMCVCLYACMCVRERDFVAQCPRRQEGLLGMGKRGIEDWNLETGANPEQGCRGQPPEQQNVMAVFVQHCTATTTPHSCCPNCYAEQSHKYSLCSSAVGKQLKQNKCNSLAQLHLPALISSGLTWGSSTTPNSP